MRLPAPERSRADLDGGLTALINIVFLLLVFFMVLGRISATDALPVEPPRSERAGDGLPDEPRVLLIAADGRLALDGSLLTLDDLPAALDRRALDALPGVGATASPDLVVTVDRAAPMALLQRVLVVLRSAGFGSVRLRAQAGP